MTEKTKRITVIIVCCLLCAAAMIGIATRFGGNTEMPSGSVSNSGSNEKDPVVDIDGDDTNTGADIKPDIDKRPQGSGIIDPGQGAVSTGKDQSIQTDPVKPQAPEKPQTPSGGTVLPDDHKAEDVPHEDRRTEDENPPVYEERPTVTPAPELPNQGDDSNGVYVPGFGYIPSSGAGTATQDGSIYENGNKVGDMG